MATFHGFRITNLRSWEGMEGLGTSGTLHWNGTRLGDFIDDGNGGCVIYRFPTAKLNQIIAKQLPSLCTDLYGPEATWMTPNLDIIVLHLADLADREKMLRNAWRRAGRRGGAVISVKVGRATHCFTTCGIPTPTEAEDMARDVLARMGETGSFEMTVWDSRPDLNEGSDEIVRDEEALAELRAFRKKVAELERDARTRFVA